VIPFANRATTHFWVGEDGQLHTRFAPEWTLTDRVRPHRVIRPEPTFVRTAQLETSSEWDYEFDYSIEEARGEGRRGRRESDRTQAVESNAKIRAANYAGVRRRWNARNGPFNAPLPWLRSRGAPCFRCFKLIRGG